MDDYWRWEKLDLTLSFPLENGQRPKEIPVVPEFAKEDENRYDLEILPKCQLICDVLEQRASIEVTSSPNPFVFRRKRIIQSALETNVQNQDGIPACEVFLEMCYRPNSALVPDFSQAVEFFVQVLEENCEMLGIIPNSLEISEDGCAIEFKVDTGFIVGIRPVLKREGNEDVFGPERMSLGEENILL